MDETASAGRIITDPAGLARQSLVAQQLEGDIGKLNVDGSAKKVFASRGNLPTDALKQRIGLC
jgi:hypothetical protein